MGNLLKITPAGPENWVVPAGVNSIQIECWGAGGHGYYAMDGSYGPGGGGGGGYGANSIVVAPGTVLTLQVGDAGLVTDSPRTADDGMASFVKIGETLIVAGIAGEDADLRTGGAGGGYAGNGTETGYLGGDGGNGGSGDGGGGGGGAGNSVSNGSTGASGTTNGGAGGDSDARTGGPGGDSGAPDGVDGESDEEGGSGGGGTYRIDSIVSGNGGSPGGGGGGCNTGFTSNGGNGQVRILWTDPKNVVLNMTVGY